MPDNLRVVRSEFSNRSSVVTLPLLVLVCAVLADFLIANAVGTSLDFDALIQLMLYAACQSGLGYWVGWKVFRSGPASAQWHVFGVFISGAIAGAIYLFAQLLLGARNMPPSESGQALLFNMAVGLIAASYLAARLSKPIKRPPHDDRDS